MGAGSLGPMGERAGHIWNLSDRLHPRRISELGEGTRKQQYLI